MRRASTWRILAISLGVTTDILAIGARAQDASTVLPLHAPPITNEIVIDQCRKPLAALMEDVKAKAAILKEAGLQRATSKKLCKLLTTYEEAEARLIHFIHINR